MHVIVRTVFVNYTSQPLSFNESVTFACCSWPPGTRLTYDNIIYILVFTDTGALILLRELALIIIKLS